MDGSSNQAAGGGDSLENLLSTLSSQIKSSDWLKQNTPEKFASENPEVAKAFEEAGNATAPKNTSNQGESDKR